MLNYWLRFPRLVLGKGNKKTTFVKSGFLYKSILAVFYFPASAVLSTLWGLTTECEMGSGVSSTL